MESYLELKKKIKNKKYWTEETNQHLKEYLLEKDQNIKNKIFEQHLLKPFYKLIENNVYTHQLYNFDHTGYDDIRQQCICHVLININKIDINRTDTSFFYFNRAILNYLKIQQIEYAKVLKRSVPIELDLSDVYGVDTPKSSKTKDNNITNSVVHSYNIDDIDHPKDIFEGFIDDLKNELLIVNTFDNNSEYKEWAIFLNSFILISESNKGMNFIENKIVFFNTMKNLNRFNSQKNYRFMQILRDKYFAYKISLGFYIKDCKKGR
jgi:hypothetical protein